MRRALALTALLALAAPDTALAHGIGGVKDLPVPGWLFLFGGAVVLVVSFSALGVLWTTPKLEADQLTGWPFPGWAQRILLSPVLRVALQAVSFAVFLAVWMAAAFGSDLPNENLAPTFIYIAFWLGMVLFSVVLGNVWAVLNPWRAAADAVAWIGNRTGVGGPRYAYPDWLGRWPAVFLLLSFVTLELVYKDPASPQVLAQATLVYSIATWGGAVAFGRRDWFRHGDGFSVYLGLLSRLSCFEVRERDGRREVAARRPLSGLTVTDREPGTVAFIATMLGSVAFDGLSRSTWWQDRIFDIKAPLVVDDPGLADLLGMGFSLLGLLASVSIFAFAYLAAVAWAQSIAGPEVSFHGVFIGSLIPIAFVYAVAHYFSLFVIQGQYLVPLASDPLGRGWDLFGTAGWQPDLTLLTPNTVWYTQVAVLVAGHVCGLVVAHDRALALVRSPSKAARTQYAMLALMIVYTVGGMWLLSLS